jgi:hypothetical protein
MLTSITDIALALKIDEKLVAEIYKQWFQRWLEARAKKENIREIAREIDNKIKW